MRPYDQVRRWIHALRDDRDGVVAAPLSAAGSVAAIEAALSTWTDDACEAIVGLPGSPFTRAAMVAPRTVPTAPLEWCLGWLLSGTEVVWKHPRGRPGLAAWAARHASGVGLPLRASEDRGDLEDADVVVVMGSNDTVEEVRRTLGPRARVLGFGHRAAAAWVHAASDADVASLARDLLLHDGRGCMTPSLVFTPDTNALAQALVPALMERARAWPPGTLADAELARRRARRDLARMIGDVHLDDEVLVVTLLQEQASLASLPRTTTLVSAADGDTARRWLAPHVGVLGTIATTEDAQGWRAFAKEARVCGLGDAQTPPLVREHDGVWTTLAWRS